MQLSRLDSLVAKPSALVPQDRINCIPHSRPRTVASALSRCQMVLKVMSLRKTARALWAHVFADSLVDSLDVHLQISPAPDHFSAVWTLHRGRFGRISYKPGTVY